MVCLKTSCLMQKHLSDSSGHLEQTVATKNTYSSASKEADVNTTFPGLQQSLSRDGTGH